MNQTEALQAIDELVRKGWRFELRVDQNCWTCDVVGAGLAHASCGGDTLEEAVSHALSHARSMEDDPAVLIARYGAWIKQNVDESFGEGSFREIRSEADEFDGGPHRIKAYVAAGSDAKTFVDQEQVFWRRLFRQPKEIQDALIIKPVWPEEAIAK